MGPATVVVASAGTDAAERIVAALDERADLPVESVAVADLLARLDGDAPGCVVVPSDDRAGLGALAAIRERAPRLPVVVVADEARDGTFPADADATTVVPADGGVPGEALWREVERATDGGTSTLRAERDRFAALVEELPDPAMVATLGDEPVIRYVNPAFEATFGYDGATVVGERVTEVVTPAPDDDYVDLGGVDPGLTVERTVRRETTDGVREFLFRGTRSPVGDGAEGLVVYTDITDRQQRARRVNTLHGTTRELLAADDPDAIAEVAVEAARDVLGLAATGIHFVVDGERRLEPAASTEQARDLFDGPPRAYGPDDGLVWGVFESGEPRAIDDLSAAGIDPNVPVESTLVLPLGEHGVLISSSPDPREFSEEDVDLARLLAANTTAALDRARGEAALRERERELRAERDRLTALFENAPIAAARVDHRDGEPIVLEVNPAFEETFGFDRERLVGENLDDHVMPDDGVLPQKSVKEEAAAGETVAREVRRRTADGLRDFLLTIAPVEPGVEDGQAYGFYIDITDRKRRQQRLRVLSRVLRHDIRNRMNVVEGNATLVAERTDDPAVATPADRIRREAEDLLELSRKTRTVERAVAASVEDRCSDLREVVRSIVRAMRDRHPACTFVAELGGEEPLWTSRALGVAIEELLTNAAEHNDADEPRVEIRLESDGGDVWVTVRDNGPGIPPQERALISEQREPTQLDHGSGVGLWMVKWVVGGQGGELVFEDRGAESGGDARGTAVRLRLPQWSDPPETVDRPEALVGDGFGEDQ